MAEPATTGEPRSYDQVRDFLNQRTRVIELTAADGARVAVCPEFQGRVMTSSFAGAQGPSLGWVNFEFIRAGQHVPAFNNYGGEDRFWLAPEGGQFGLFFSLGLTQVVQNWLTPPEINTGSFQVESTDARSCRLTRRVRVANAAEASFDVAVERALRVLPADEFRKFFSDKAARAAGLLGNERKPSPFVGFESKNTITNVGPTAWTLNSGLISIWALGQFPAGEQTVIIVPFKDGQESQLGPAVETDYFGPIPAERLKVVRPAVILFRGDGKQRAKLGVSARRVRPMAGSFDLATGILTLVQFSLPPDPARHFYVNNAWKALQEKPFGGDVFNSYNDGPAEPGAKALGGFYELESLAPTRPLAKGEKLVHEHRTFHIQTDETNAADLLRETLGADLADIRTFLGK